MMEESKKNIIVVIASLIAGLSVALFGFIQFFPAYNFHIFLSIAAVVSCVGPTIVLELKYRRRNKIDENLPQLLNDLAESQETGMTLIQSLEESSHRRYGPLTTELKKMIIKLSWGIKFEVAFQDFAKNTQTEMTKKVVTLILQSVRMGGNLKKTFIATAAFTRKMIDIKKERSAQLRQYVITIYTIMVIFQIILIVLYQSFFTPFSSSGDHFLTLKTSPESFKGVLSDLAIIEAFVGGIIAGKLGEGTVYLGLKHSIILLLISLFFVGFLL
jgi:archaeal flagellar protein FlaJ